MKNLHTLPVSNIDAVMMTWTVLQAQAGVPLCTITGDRHYERMVIFLNTLLDEIGDLDAQPRHPLAGLLDVVTHFIGEYDDVHENKIEEVTDKLSMEAMANEGGGTRNPNLKTQRAIKAAKAGRTTRTNIKDL